MIFPDGQAPDHWDPEPKERTWYRSTQTGDRGYLVRRDGKDRVRLDRPNEDIHRPLNGDDWALDEDYRPYTRFQVSHLAWQTDRLLLRMMGLPNDSRLDWSTLSEEKRMKFMKSGPEDDGLRSELWSAIMGVLEKHSR